MRDCFLFDHIHYFFIVSNFIIFSYWLVLYQLQDSDHSIFKGHFICFSFTIVKPSLNPRTSFNHYFLCLKFCSFRTYWFNQVTFYRCYAEVNELLMSLKLFLTAFSSKTRKYHFCNYFILIFILILMMIFLNRYWILMSFDLKFFRWINFYVISSLMYCIFLLWFFFNHFS
jgi:hypothetical protein